MDMSIIKLAEPTPRAPNPRLIEQLEEALNEAKTGKLSSMVLVKVMSDGFVQFDRNISMGDWSRMAGAISYAHHHHMIKWCEDD
jgi:hypothetical protein